MDEVRHTRAPTEGTSVRPHQRGGPLGVHQREGVQSRGGGGGDAQHPAVVIPGQRQPRANAVVGGPRRRRGNCSSGGAGGAGGGGRRRRPGLALVPLVTAAVLRLEQAHSQGREKTSMYTVTCSASPHT